MSNTAFKQGDRVKVVKDKFAELLGLDDVDSLVGEIGTVISVLGDESNNYELLTIVKFDSSEIQELGFDDDELELINE